jgi:hypothetical protein
MSTDMDEIKVLVIGQNRNINVAKFPIQENKLIISKDETEPFFDADGIFQMKNVCQWPLIGRLITRRRRREPCMMHILGKEHVEKLKAPTTDLFEPLSNDERKEIVKREIAKALGKFKPISGIAVIALFGMGLANLILLLLHAKGMIV